MIDALKNDVKELLEVSLVERQVLISTLEESPQNNQGIENQLIS
jgi:hypothetical protein